MAMLLNTILISGVLTTGLSTYRHENPAKKRLDTKYMKSILKL